MAAQVPKGGISYPAYLALVFEIGLERSPDFASMNTIDGKHKH